MWSSRRHESTVDRDIVFIPLDGPRSTYLLKIRHTGNHARTRVEFGCFSFNKVLDSDTMNYKYYFVDDIEKSYPWGPNETITINYFDDANKTFPQVGIDQDMVAMFYKFVGSKVISMLITIHDVIGFRHVVYLEHKTCTCREFQLSGKPCNHAIAFITSVRGVCLEHHVDDYYTVQRFRATYEQLIPSLPNKSRWPKVDHEFFLSPAILKKTSGRPRKNKCKGCTNKGGKRQGGKGKSGSHHCPTCKGFCTSLAQLQRRGLPKKKKKKTIQATSETSIIVALAATSCYAQTMTYPPSQGIQSIGEKMANQNSSGLGRSVRSRSITGSNHPEPLTMVISPPTPREQTSPLASKKGKGKAKADKGNTIAVAPNNPAMGTRSKRKASGVNCELKYGITAFWCYNVLE